MLSKCANPECSEQFRYLHQGKIFFLTPSPALQAVSHRLPRVLTERFWLCDRCSKELTLTWDGSQPKLAPLPPKPDILPAQAPDKTEKKESKQLARMTAAV